MEEINHKTPGIGEHFPEMTLNTTHGKINFPEDMKGKWVVLFSHPADFTPVCTSEFMAFAEEAPEFKKMNTELIGLSIDGMSSHLKWVEWIKDNEGIEIPFPIIADNLGLVASQLQMIQPAKGSSTIRAVYVIDDKGILRMILLYPQEIGRNIDEIKRAVKALQFSDKNKVAMPANWPHNRRYHDEVFLPPPQDEKQKQERIKMGKDGEVECKDWWICTKKI